MLPADNPHLTPLIELLEDFTQDWDHEFSGEMGPDTRLLADLGFESIDIIQLVVAIQEEVVRRKLSFDQLLMKDGRYVDDLSIGQIAGYLAANT
ncbi:phosphopantetheine-binding protein [Panacagrimonas sp.]|uniref:phosphopantetheine-binding protein n=1 Tax=Panacagrimonas sp. TaxID=2480088 RepID=UPI003B52FCD0